MRSVSFGPNFFVWRVLRPCYQWRNADRTWISRICAHHTRAHWKIDSKRKHPMNYDESAINYNGIQHSLSTYSLAKCNLLLHAHMKSTPTKNTGRMGNKGKFQRQRADRGGRSPPQTRTLRVSEWKFGFQIVPWHARIPSSGQARKL